MFGRFIDKNYNHFNSKSVKEAVGAWKQFYSEGGKMVVSLGGAMSTAGIGATLAPLIEKGLVAAISTTGANLEEDYFRAVGYDQYKMIKNVSELTEEDDEKILKDGGSRVYDAIIPDQLVGNIARDLSPILQSCCKNNEKIAPHELFFKLMREKRDVLEDSWLYAAMKKDVHICTPGWEDSTIGNMVVGEKVLGNLPHLNFIKSGLEQMDDLVNWYEVTTKNQPLGFFQLGGGISGDFPICVVPLLSVDLKRNPKRWQYFCQITDSVTSYGSYSGATPAEKISWDKLEKGSPKFSINSDATIVAPLIFSAVLEEFLSS